MPEVIIVNSIAERIKQRRQALNLSAEEVADRIGVSYATMYRYENGDIVKISIGKLQPLAIALRTTPAWLMGWEESAQFSVESELLACFADMNEEGRRALLATARGLAAQSCYKKDQSKIG